VSGEVKRERLSRLERLQEGISLKKNGGSIGSIQEVLIEGASRLGKGRIMGRTRSNKIVNFEGSENQRGTLCPIKITGATANSLVGDAMNQSRSLFN
jgi:tRNA-2-methylthio-N6-dimethylallyladenosine synthase